MGQIDFDRMAERLAVQCAEACGDDPLEPILNEAVRSVAAQAAAEAESQMKADKRFNDNETINRLRRENDLLTGLLAHEEEALKIYANGDLAARFMVYQEETRKQIDEAESEIERLTNLLREATS